VGVIKANQWERQNRGYEEVAVTELLLTGKYFVVGAQLYYVKDMKPDQGLLLIENCYTNKVEWLSASKARTIAKEVIQATCEIMPVS
jgi:hypothetical protein